MSIILEIFTSVGSKSTAKLFFIRKIQHSMTLSCKSRTVKGFTYKMEKPSEFPTLRGYCTPNLKLACFACYYKIVNFFYNNICILRQIVQGTQKLH